MKDHDREYSSSSAFLLTENSFFRCSLRFQRHKLQVSLRPSSFNSFLGSSVMAKYKIIADENKKGFFRASNLVTSQVVTLKQLGFPGEEGVPALLIKEITMIKELQHPNIIKLIELLASDDRISLTLVYEFMDTSLTSFMQIYPNVIKIPQTIKELVRQILLGVSRYHSFDIVHGALKPQNMFVNPSSNTLKITDFIWPRSALNSESEDPNEESNFNYKAPEILVDHKQITTALDVWSVGCIFAEMVTQKPLFPAKTEFHQLAKIFSIMGTPTEETWPGINSLYEYIRIYNYGKPKDLRELVPDLEPAGIDLLYKLLFIDPKRRITANQALEHEYFRI